jgi:hypothetical protein
MFFEQPKQESWYDDAEVCLNGHVINPTVRASPELNRNYCPDCGARTITNCSNCGTAIRGDYHSSVVVAIGFPYDPPAYCGECGSAFPWVEARLAAARELAKDLEELSEQERQELAASLDDLVRDVPMTQVSAGRFKRLVAKAGAGAADAFRDVLVDVMSETAKKIIWPS